MKIALGIEYNGAGFCGWQTQPGACGVQDHVEAAIAHIAHARVGTICAGRTDAGVHALEQVVHFDSDAERPLSAWVRGVNASLPAGIAVLWSCEVSAEFSARYSAVNRRYRYLLLNRPVRPAVAQGRVGWCHVRLDEQRMGEAAHRLTGEHDFSAFRSSQCQARSPVRELREATVTRRGDHIMFDFCANAFLHHMVRNLVGTLVQVGQHKHEPSWASEVLESRNRALAAPTFDAAGLYFVSAGYDAAWGLPQQEALAEHDQIIPA